MPRNLNRAEFIGRLGDFPDMRYTPSGLEITRIRLAVSNDRYSKEKEEWEERTDWIGITFFGTPANKVAEKLSKGDKIFVVARVQNNEYEDKSGVTIRTYNFIGEHYELVEKGKYSREDEEKGEEKEKTTSKKVDNKVDYDDDDDDMPPWD